MKRFRKVFVLSAFLLFGLVLGACQPIVSPTESESAAPGTAAVEEDKIANATSAGPSIIAQEAAILVYPEGWPGKWPDEPAAELVQLRPGSNGWTCLPDRPDTPGNDPMCVNDTYLELLKAQYANLDAPSSGIGIGYMLQGGGPIGSPPHMMVFTPESNAVLPTFSSDPGPLPWVMYPETSRAHLMVTMIYGDN